MEIANEKHSIAAWIWRDKEKYTLESKMNRTNENGE